MVKSRRARRLVALVASACAVPLGAWGFTLIEAQVEVTISDTQYAFAYSQLGAADYTGFTVYNPEAAQLTIQSALAPFGLLQNDMVQDDFLLLDGTLFLEIEQTDVDPRAGRASLRIAYRMDVRRSDLRGDAFVRAIRDRMGVRYVRALERAYDGRIRARLRDARLMRFNSEGRWVRAVREIRANEVDVRYQGRMVPNDTLGHYGYFEDAGSSYVWAVTDTNSRYAVGVTFDRDRDGILNPADNCPDAANPDQRDTDADEAGDACDDDDDNDGIDDDGDNCPLHANADQADLDGDGVGDACDSDIDGDGVGGGDDACGQTAVGAVVNAEGCSVGDLCPCDSEWKNHGAYVRCNAKTSGEFVEAGLMTDEDKDALVSAAAESACGAGT